VFQSVSNNLLNTQTSRLAIEYYAVLAADEDKVETEAKTLLEKIDSFYEGKNSLYLQLVKGRTLVLLAEKDADYKTDAMKIFDSFIVRSDTTRETRYRPIIEILKLYPNDPPDHALTLINELSDAALADDLEVILPAAFIQRRLNNIDAYNRLLNANRQARNIAGEITLQWLKADNEPANVLDAALAAEAALKDKPEKHRELLKRLAETNIAANPVIDYAAAAALADSNQDEAAYLLIRASNLQNAQPEKTLKLSAEQIAKQASNMAYRVFVKEPNQCELVEAAFENYFQISSEPDEDLEYAYTQVLTLCDKYEQALELLEDIAAGDGQYSARAGLDLATSKVQTYKANDKETQAHLLEEFFKGFKAEPDCTYVGPAVTLLRTFLDENPAIEQQDKYSAEAFSRWVNISAFAYHCEQNETNGLVLAECLILDPNANEQQLSDAELLLKEISENIDANNIDLLRCRARLAQKKERFEEAVTLWSKITETLKSEFPSADEPSWQWWRGKYYQLFCAEQTDSVSGDVARNIEILLALYSEIPDYWAERLESLAKDSR
jgi:hypothetical protein